jgi:hypothetical protein
MKKWLTNLALILFLAAAAHGQSAQVGTNANSTQQAMVIAGSNTVGTASFAAPIPGRPTVALGTGGTLPINQYSVVLTYTTATGETLPSSSFIINVPAAGSFVVTSPPAATGATSYNVYAGLVSGTETKQGNAISIGTNYTQSSTLSAGTALPSLGVVVPLQINAAGSLVVQQANIAGTNDPCMNAAVLKSSVPINITTAATTSLVAVSGTKAVYVCGLSISIAPSATTADTALIEYGTGAACTGAVALTGTFGNGDLTTAAPPLYVTLADPGTSMTAPSANGICLLSAGTTVNIQGVLQYVQQ